MISVALIRACNAVQFPKKEVHRIASFVCRKEKVSTADLSFVFVDDTKIRTINKQFLNHDYVTDIITFSLEEKNVAAEIYINVRQAKRQAKEHLVTIRNEMTRLVVHGTLHALGYDDMTPALKKTMVERQERYVEQLTQVRQLE